MTSPHRQYRAALALAIAGQATLIGAMYYINCGATSAILSVPVCQPWFPDSVVPLLPWLRLLGEPGFSVLPSFQLADSAPVPDWLHEWAWMITVGGVDVVIWTAGIGSSLMATARLRSARVRQRGQRVD